MKKIFPILLLIYHSHMLLAQNNAAKAEKPPIDTSVFNKWPSLDHSPALSNDGNYALYTINNQPVRSQTLVIQSVNASWKMEFPFVSNASFTDDSRKVIFIKPDDSLTLLTLGSTTVESIPQVQAFQLFMQGVDEWMIYQLANEKKELMLRKLNTENQTAFKDITSYLLSNKGNTLLLETGLRKDDSAVTQRLIWVNLSNNKSNIIWEGVQANNFIFDNTGSQLAFIVNDAGGNSIWYYKEGTEKAVLLASDQSDGIDRGLRIGEGNIWRFTRDGSKLLFSLKKMASPSPRPGAVSVDIWNYMDPKLKSQELKELTSGLPSYATAIDLKDHHIIRLQQEYERLQFSKQDDIVLVINRKGNTEESGWNAAAQASYYLLDIKSGKRKPVNANLGDEGEIALSPQGKYIIYPDREKRNYFSYNLGTGISHNITRSLPIPLIDTSYDRTPGPKPRGLYGIAAWLGKDTAVLIYDKYDIWLLDPTEQKAPINVTNGYGRRHDIVLRLTQDYPDKSITANERLLLKAFNCRTKHNGFYSTMLSRKGDPELLTMGAYVYDIPFNPVTIYSPFAPIKARDAYAYLVKQESAAQSPNFFYTHDFKTFTALSNLYPEIAYNWLSSELVTWKALDGHPLQGILYKPENFDPKKKYPVIINYYDKKSDGLNKYHKPRVMYDQINIPWFVSNGYLVFLPDIRYTIGRPGQSMYNAVVAGAKHLTKFSWVDADRIGIQGHSWGGYETNYLITHTGMFAAAMSSSGYCDYISVYGAITLDGTPYFQSATETGLSRIGVTLWQRPDLYIDNSPVLRADKVTTPLLMMNNKEDGVVPFSQGVQFFMALRRLGKKVWMLQYDGMPHSVYGPAALDYTIRVTQFFDHYLKGPPAPKWMTRGIPANMKMVDDGLELDNEIKIPGKGLLIAEEKLAR